MNNQNVTLEQETRYRLLKILAEEHHLTQREMAQRVGISLGKLNYCVTDLAKRGLIKINRFKSAENKKAYAYVLTPHGMQEKARITVSFLKRKMAEYETLKRQIAELVKEVDQEDLSQAEQERIYQSMGPAKKLRAALQLYHSARQLKAAGLRAQHPDWSDEEIQNEVREIFLYART